MQIRFINHVKQSWNMEEQLRKICKMEDLGVILVCHYWHKLSVMLLSPGPMTSVTLVDDLPVIGFNHALSRFLWGHDNQLSMEHDGRPDLHQQRFFYVFLYFSRLLSVINENHLYLKYRVEIQLNKTIKDNKINKNQVN